MQPEFQAFLKPLVAALVAAGAGLVAGVTRIGPAFGRGAGRANRPLGWQPPRSLHDSGPDVSGPPPQRQGHRPVRRYLKIQHSLDLMQPIGQRGWRQRGLLLQ